MAYTLSTPTKGVALGTAFRVDFKLIPLMKGLMIKPIKCELVEIRTLQLERCPRKNVIRRVIVRNDWVLPDDIETVDIDGEYGYRFHRLIQTPRSLAGCVQSVDTRGIEVKHMVKCALRVQNPDEHISEVWMPPTSLTFLRHLAHERRYK